MRSSRPSPMTEQGAQELITVAGVLDAHGWEIMAWLESVTGRRDFAEDIYQEFCVDIWRGVPGFRGEASARTWCFRVARNAWHRTASRTEGRARRDAEAWHREALPDRLRVHVAATLQTPSTLDLPGLDRVFLALRNEVLSQQEKELLELRVGHELSWQEIAQIFSENPDADPATRRREASRLRKMFSRIARRLQDEAEQRGLGDRLRDLARRGEGHRP